MPTKTKTVKEHNAEVRKERAGRPGFDARMQTFVVARDRKLGRILLGGLGALGVGEMWFDEEPKHTTYPGYAEAELRS